MTIESKALLYARNRIPSERIAGLYAGIDSWRCAREAGLIFLRRDLADDA
jgi:hypothetical protein